MPSQLNCPNCKTPLNGNYCSNCGQNQNGIDRFFLTLVNEAFENIFSFHSRTWKTLFALLFRPGFLSNEYFRGRRARYLQPIRLYFITSISFFVMLSVINFITEQGRPDASSDKGPVVVQIEAEDIPTTDAPEGAIAGQPPVTIEPSAEGSDGGGLFSPEGEFQQDKITLSIPFVSEDLERRLTVKFRIQLAKAIEVAKNDPQEVASLLLELAPPVIFCLLPIFAILLKLFYFTKEFYYAEHLVFAVHTHCFVFLTLTFYSAIEALFPQSGSIGSWVGFGIGVWIPLYLWRSLKNVYQQGRFFTSLKFLSLGTFYLILLGFGILLAVLVGVMTL